MTYRLATRFGRNSHQISGREALDNETLYRHVPSIFAREAHDSRSERYVYVPTIEIVEGLRREGWFPFFAVQAVPRDGERMGHATHMLRLRRDDGIGKQEAAEVIIVNSHDGARGIRTALSSFCRFPRGRPRKALVGPKQAPKRDKPFGRFVSQLLACAVRVGTENC